MNKSTEPPPCGTHPNSATPMLIYMTVEQFAEHRQVCRATVFTWINVGLPSVKQGRLRRIRVEVADAWLDAGNASLAQHVVNRAPVNREAPHA